MKTVLEGFARGIELTVQRSVTGRGVSGWFSYAFGRNRYHDIVSGESYWGDTISATHERVRALPPFRSRQLRGQAPHRQQLSDSRLLCQATALTSLTDARNTERLPVYAGSICARTGRSTGHTRRLTLFAEVINMLNRDNIASARRGST